MGVTGRFWGTRLVSCVFVSGIEGSLTFISGTRGFTSSIDGKGVIGNRGALRCTSSVGARLDFKYVCSIALSVLCCWARLPYAEDGHCSIWQAFRSACAKICTLAKRWPGSLERAVSTTLSICGEMLGTFSRREGGSTNMCWLATSKNVPWKGQLPVSHSYTSTPRAYWSLAGTGLPWSCSGAI